MGIIGTVIIAIVGMQPITFTETFEDVRSCNVRMTQVLGAALESGILAAPIEVFGYTCRPNGEDA